MISPKIPKITKPRTIVKWVVILVAFIIISNPTLIPFLSPETKQALSETWKSIFGDVGHLTSSLTFNWATLFRVIAIILLMVVITKIDKVDAEKLAAAEADVRANVKKTELYKVNALQPVDEAVFRALMARAKENGEI